MMTVITSIPLVFFLTIGQTGVTPTVLQVPFNSWDDCRRAGQEYQMQMKASRPVNPYTRGAYDTYACLPMRLEDARAWQSGTLEERKP